VQSLIRSISVYSKVVVCSDNFYFDALDNDLDLATVNFGKGRIYVYVLDTIDIIRTMGVLKSKRDYLELTNK
jgi:hypothetical protein